MIDRQKLIAMAQEAWLSEERQLHPLIGQEGERLALQRSVFIAAWVLGYEAALAADSAGEGQ